MGLSSSGGNKQNNELDGSLDDGAIVAEINITPLTDVFLVLLIIFMVTSSVMTQTGINVQLPSAKQASEPSEASGIVVTVTSSSGILLNGKAVSEDNLGAEMKAALDKTKDKVVVVEGDRRAVLGTIVRVMEEGKRAGAAKFAVATQGEN